LVNVVLKHDDFSSPNQPGGKQDEEEGVVAMSSRCSVTVVRVAAADGPSGREPVAKVIKKLFFVAAGVPDNELMCAHFYLSLISVGNARSLALKWSTCFIRPD
jgi:hypothetical protein